MQMAAPLFHLSISIVLVRLAGAHEYGVYSYCLSIFGIILYPITTSFSTLIIRNLAIHHARCEWALLRGLLKRASQWAVAVSATLIGIGVLIGSFFNEITPGSNEVFFALLLLTPLVIFNEFRSAALRGLRHIIWGQFPELIVIPATTLLLATLLYVNVNDTTALTLVGLQILATLCAFLIGSALLRKHFPPEIHSVSPIYQNRLWLRGILPLMLLNGSLQIESELVIMLLGQFASVESSGIYRICARGAGLIPFVFFALNMATAPTFSRLYALGHLTELSRLVAKTTHYALIAALPITFAFIFFGDRILHIFYGPDFVIGANAMAILCVAKVFSVGTGPTACLLNSTGHERDTLKSSLIALMLTLSLSLLLIPCCGLIGAAVASAVSLVFRSGLNSWFVFRRFNISPLAAFTRGQFFHKSK